MIKILKNLGKKFVADNDKIKTSKVKKKSRKRKLGNTKELTEKLLVSIKEEVNRNGYKNMKISSLIKRVGIGKRSTNNVSTFNERLKDYGIHANPKFSKDRALKSLIKFTAHPEDILGDLFEKEKQLEDYIEKNELYKMLKINTVKRQHSPKGTRDRLDFKGVGNEAIVVLELKNEGGGKTAVEQVLRYSTLLQKEHPKSKIRKILVTGIENYETRLALNGMNKQDIENFEWYLYDYNKAQDTLKFKRVLI